MPRSCTICISSDLEAINTALLNGEPFRRIAGRTGTGATSLQRHKQQHIPGSLALAREAGQIAHGDDLMGQLQALQGRTL